MPSTELAGSHSAAQTLPDELVSQKQPGREGVTRQFTWPEVKKVVAANRLELLGRVTPKELAYREDMRQIREKYGSVVNYIRNVKLADFIADDLAEHLMILNDYPYALPEDAAHYIVWSKKTLTPGIVPDPAVREIIVTRLDELIGQGKYEWVWFVNPLHLQSIPEVVHGHLIVQRL
ncbi:hypothetical protein H4R20_002356 [Coemansia guatemalensis]|uniref:Uncharacterized protein n=1 Tax=Coemansia guatemalensis TaxID=2761395 RepID=A0A9W8HVL9_9FUNG|nr:hypothetical protein H4R20_002356 [Coemansia guatemalensis]